MNRESLSFGIYVGKPRLSTSKLDKITYATSDEVIYALDELSDQFERYKNRIPARQHKNITIDIYADNAVNSSELIPITDYISLITNKIIYVVVKCFEIDSGGMRMKRIPIEKMSLEHGKPLNELLEIGVGGN